MKSIIKIIIICLILATVIGISQNNSSDDTDYNYSTDNLNNAFFIGNLSKDYHFRSMYDDSMKFQIISQDSYYTNATIEINISHISNITFKNNLMIIQTK